MKKPKTPLPIVGCCIQNDDRGFTLLEALIALAIFSIGVLAVAGMQSHSITVSNSSMHHMESDSRITDMVERLKNRQWLENDGDPWNDDPLLQDVNGDGAPGLGATDGGADYTVNLGQYTIFYNVAHDINQALTQRINLIVRWTYKGQREVNITFIKACNVL
jgi:prepilin-type N-terminal cleavage/methylation domain-containing protein